jgi:ribosomal protein L40E
MICSRCYHINEVTAPVCVKCRHDAGTPVNKENAENLRGTMQRLGTGSGPDPVLVSKLEKLL